MESINRLTQKIDVLLNSPLNQKIKKLWMYNKDGGKNEWHGIPRPSQEINLIPFTVDLEIKLWSEILHFDVEEFYTNSQCYLTNTLKMIIYRFEQIRDCTPIEKSIPIWIGTSFEPSLFGIETIYLKDQSPWPHKEPLIKDYKDINKLNFHGVWNSGLMPLALRMYEEIREMISDDYEVIFPEWRRGPFGVACDLRGTENLLADFIINPEFVHDLMSFITTARKAWVNDRAKFLGQEITKGDIDDDEISTPTLSPEQYEEFILPYEQQLCEFHGGIRYWHSCGDTSKLVYSIRNIPNIDLFHIGPWTDLKSARKAFGKDTAFEKCLMPVSDIQLASEERMASVLDEIKKVLEGSSFTVRADGLNIIYSAKDDLEAISKWIRIAYKKLCVKK